MYLSFFLIFSVLSGCSEDKFVDAKFGDPTLIEEEEMKLLESKQDNSVKKVFLVKKNSTYILAENILDKFSDDWPFRDAVTILGYASQVEEWQLIDAENTNPESQFCKIRIELTELIPETEEWILCIEDIHELAEEIDGIIVLDQDLEIQCSL